MNIKRTDTQVLSNSSNFGLNLTSFNETVTDSTIIAERYIDLFAKNRIPSAFKTTAYTLDDYKRDLQFLNRKMEAVRKTLSIWESYKIGEVAFTRDELEYKLGALPPNTGLVVNFEADNLQIGDKTYSQGDVIFTDYIGNQYTLKSFSGGYYYPYKYNRVEENSNIYEIHYHYTTAQPTEGTQTLVDNVALEQPSKNINMQLEQAEVSNDRYWATEIIEAGQSISLDAIYKDDQLVYPIVAWFKIDNNQIKEDRIYLDIEWSYNAATQTIVLTNPTVFNCWCEVR